MKKDTTNKVLVDAIAKQLIQSKGRFITNEIRDGLKNMGVEFGSVDELINFAELQITRQLIGKLTFPDGKRKYCSTREQLSLDFGMDYVFYPAESIRRKRDQKWMNLDWIRSHVSAIFHRSPIIPDWAIEEIIQTIQEVFDKIKDAA
jgi:hypothetical protein